MRGDNRDTNDALGATRADIVGSARRRVPAGGLVLFVLSRWWTLAAIAGGVVSVLLWPSASPAAVPDTVRP